MSRPITLMDVKQALRDKRFRDSLPSNFKEDITKFLNNPGCACNMPIYKKVMTEAQQQIQQYYPGRPVSQLDEEVKKLADNNWTVINCKIDELEPKLRKLAPGRKQIAISRYEDMVTVIVNELDIIY